MTKTFESVVDFFAGISNINNGGCGITAYALYSWLENNNQLLDDTKIYYLEDDTFGRYISPDNVFGNGNAFSCSHAVLFHNGSWIDGDGFFESYFDMPTINKFWSEPIEYAVPNHIVHNFMKFSLFGYGWEECWNNKFHRNKYLPKIEQELNLKLRML